MRHFLEVDDLTPDELNRVLELAVEPEPSRVLDGLGMALIFEKPSARTRNSTEMAIVQLGGHPIYIDGAEIGLDTRERLEDVVMVLGGYHALLGARVFAHGTVERMADVRRVPVVNLLSDLGHPLQCLADLLCMRREFGSLVGRTVAYIGDANNVARSLALGAGLASMSFRIASPAGYGFSAVDLDRIRACGVEPVVTGRVEEAVDGSDVVYTDTWTSMGNEKEAEQRRRDFEGFTITEQTMTWAHDDAVFMHCLPAHRGEEATDEVLDGPRSRIWVQAADRMHATRGLLIWLMDVNSSNNVGAES